MHEKIFWIQVSGTNLTYTDCVVADKVKACDSILGVYSSEMGCEMYDYLKPLH